MERVYIRSTDTYGNHCSELLYAKSHVAPLKQTNLPRLELCGAVLLSRLVRKLGFAPNPPIGKHLLQIGWPKYIRESPLPKEWEHIPIYIPYALNPADVVSRGASPKQPTQTTLWWHGPKFLKYDEELWPAQNLYQCLSRPLANLTYSTGLVAYLSY
ncbi:Pao retrotransposon peptidase [Popillia japonica]|uniref:Pao retrotransposon peptidase n=1 Tax=Popillia japonica TaxID=7064 RepID=A0AAW1I8J1_POPJA